MQRCGLQVEPAIQVTVAMMFWRVGTMVRGVVPVTVSVVCWTGVWEGVADVEGREGKVWTMRWHLLPRCFLWWAHRVRRQLERGQPHLPTSHTSSFPSSHQGGRHRQAHQPDCRCPSRPGVARTCRRRSRKPHRRKGPHQRYRAASCLPQGP